MKNDNLNKLHGMILISMIMLLLSGCGQKAVEQENGSNHESDGVSGLEKKVTAIGMTKEEMIADFEYLYTSMKENYPMFGVSKRLYDFDWLNNEEDYLHRINQCENDLEFYMEIESIIEDLHGLGHLGLLSPTSYASHSLLTNKDGDFFDYESKFQSEGAKAKYLEWMKIVPKKAREKQGQMLFHAETISGGETAYIKIPTFYVRGNAGKVNHIESVQKSVEELYSQLENIDNLIIDIRGNGGGYNYFWQYSLVAPLIDERKTIDLYGFYRGGDLIRSRVQKMRYKQNNMSDFPEELELAPEEVFEDFVVWEKKTVEVLPTKRQSFNGQIYLLIDDGVYSAAEYFAQFVKNTGWATIVGSQSGGDAVIDGKFFYDLPNSGLVVHYSKSLTLDSKGQVSEEYGTKPDVVIGEDEDALDVTLELIKERKQ